MQPNEVNGHVTSCVALNVTGVECVQFRRVENTRTRRTCWERQHLKIGLLTKRQNIQLRLILTDSMIISVMRTDDDDDEAEDDCRHHHHRRLIAAVVIVDFL